MSDDDSSVLNAEPSAVPSVARRPVPDVSGLDIAFGNIGHLPRMDEIPDDFWKWGKPYSKLVSKWFFAGLKQDDIACLRPREGVDKTKALAAVGAILRSFAPKHEHKEAGAAYLLSEWFELSPPTKPVNNGTASNTDSSQKNLP